MKRNWMAASLLAGSLAFGVSSGAGQAFAEDATPAPTAATAVAWSGLFQTQDNLTGGATMALSLAHVRVRGVIAVDSEDTLAIMPDYATSGFTLLDAYGVHKFNDIDGFSIMAGQFKFAFGDNRYLTPGQLKRTSYNVINALVPGGATAKAWDLGIEAKEQTGRLSLQVDAIQGDGPNVTADPNNTIDYAARAEWKDSHFVLGVSDYYGKGGQTLAQTYATFQDWFGVHGRLMVESLDFRAEAIFAPNNADGFDTQLSVKPVSWFEPLAWFETAWTTKGTTANNAGLGVNLWAGAKTRLSLDLSFTGISDILSQDTWTLQAEQIF